MKTLILIRHADAKKLKKGGYDLKRDLTKQGEKDAEALAKNLCMDPEFNPGVVLSSMSFRALHTAGILAKKLGMKKEQVAALEKLYTQTTPAILTGLLQEMAKDTAMAVVVGHNPWLEKVVQELLPAFHYEIPKASALSLKFDVVSWSDIKPEKCSFQYLKIIKNSSDLPVLDRMLVRDIGKKAVKEIGAAVVKSTGSFQLGKKKKLIRASKKLMKKFLKSPGVITVNSLAELEAQAVRLKEEYEKKVRKVELKKAEKKEKLTRKLAKINNIAKIGGEGNKNNIAAKINVEGNKTSNEVKTPRP